MKKLLSILVMGLLFSGSAYADTYIMCELSHMKRHDSFKIEPLSSGGPGFLMFNKKEIKTLWDPARKVFKIKEDVIKYDQYEVTFKFINSSKIYNDEPSTAKINRIEGTLEDTNSMRTHYYNCKKISKLDLPKKNVSTKF